MKKIIYCGSFIVVFLVVTYIQWLYVKLGAAHTGDPALGKGYTVLAAVLALLLITAAVMLSRASLLKVYPVVVLMLGLGYMYVFPAMSAPDEIAHFISAYKLSNRIMGGRVTTSDGHVVIRATDLILEDADGEYVFDSEASIKEEVLIPKAGSYGKVISGKLEESSYKFFFTEGIGFNDNTDVSFEGKAYKKAQSLHAPVNTVASVYLPGAAGITIARILNLNFVGLAVLGRLCNLTVFIIFGCLSIYFLPRFKELIFAVSLLPMTLELAASFSYDAVMIGSIMFFISYVFYLVYEKDSFDIKDLALIAALSGLVFSCKMVYTPLLLLLFAVPVYKFWSSDGTVKRENISFFIISAIVVLLSWAAAMYLVNKAAIVDYSAGTNGSLEWAGEESYTINYLIHNRLKTFKIFYNTVILQLEYYHQTMIGFYLGHADEVIGVPYVAFVSFNIGILLLASGDGSEPLLQKKERILAAAATALTVFLVLLSMLIAWTPVSSEFIEGVNGRYFLPVLPLMLLLLKNNLIVIKKNIKRQVLFMLIYLNALSLLKIFSTVCIRL